MSQLRSYASTDVSAPVLDGQAGSLINVLNGCLVTGYGAISPPSPAWTHPVATAGNIASYLQGAGCGFGMVINDNGPNGTATFKEAWATGWETVAGVGSPVGSGSGQFPTPVQLLTTGHVVIRKSVAASAVARGWRVFADSSTVYVVIDTGDTASFVHFFAFGDIYSLGGVTDAYRCIIAGKPTENSIPSGNDNVFTNSRLAAALTGKYMPRTFGGGGSSVVVLGAGDNLMTAADGNLDGLIQPPNGPDNSYHMCAWRIHETAAKNVRGRMRGIYQMLHTRTTFADGQVFNGAGDFAGKTFQIIRDVGAAPSLQGAIAIETSNTVETNA